MKFFLTLFLCTTVLFNYAQKDSANHYYNLANQFFKEKKFLLAEKNYQKSLVFDKTNFNTNLELAQSNLEMKRYRDAIIYFKAAEQLQPGNKIALDQIAVLSFNTKQWEDAINFSKKCLTFKVGEKVNYRIAKSYFAQEDFVNSSKYLQAAANEDPKNADVPYTMGNIWMEMNNSKKALEMFEIALSIDTSNAQWFYEIAELYREFGNGKKALENYDKAVAKGITYDLNFQTTMGIVNIDNGNYDKGVSILQKVIAKKPMDKDLFNDMAFAFYKQKKYQDAIKWWDEILRFDKQDAKALYMIGISFQKDGNKEKGAKLCDAAIALDPTLASLKQEMKMPTGMGL